jgi:hypothetical protein
VVIVALVTLDLRDGGPIIEVMGGFAEGVVGGGRASEEVKEPWEHGLSDFFIEIAGGEKEINGIQVLIVIFADED